MTSYDDNPPDGGKPVGWLPEVMPAPEPPAPEGGEGGREIVRIVQPDRSIDEVTVTLYKPGRYSIVFDPLRPDAVRVYSAAADGSGMVGVMWTET